MLIINVKDNESIERALKRYRRKHRNTQLMKELRRRERFVKPSMKRRKELLKEGFLRLLEMLEDDDDVQNVYHNADISDEELSRIAG